MNKLVKNVLMFGTGAVLGIYAYGCHILERTKNGTAYVYYKNRDGNYEYGINPMTESKQEEEQEVPE